MKQDYKGFAKKEDLQQQKEFRRVLIGTPALNGKVHAWYTDSLINSTKLCIQNGINLLPVMLINESILPMARNELLSIAYKENVESIVFIDSDQIWDPNCLLDLINSSYDVIGVPVVSKTDEPGNFNVKIQNFDHLQQDDNGNVLVDSIGTGFLKLSRKALEALWNTNPTVEFRGKELKLICEYATNYQSFIGEDIYLCSKLKELDFDVWVNTNFTCGHIGDKVWLGDFKDFLNYIQTNNQ